MTEPQPLDRLDVTPGTRREDFLRGLRRAKRYLEEPRRALWDLEIARDLERTARDLRAWAADPPTDPSRQVLFVSMTNAPAVIKSHMTFAKALQGRGLWPVFVLHEGSRWALRYLERIGFSDVVLWDGRASANAADTRAAATADEILSARPTTRDLKDLEIDGVRVGRHALSSAIRKRLHGRFDLSDPTDRDWLRPFLIRAIRGAHFARPIFESRPIEQVIVRDAGYVPNGSIMDSAINAGLRPVRVERGQWRGRWLATRSTDEKRTRSLWSLAPSTWGRVSHLPLSAGEERALDADFEARYDPSHEQDYYRYQAGKQRFGREEVRARLGVAPDRKIAVIFAHITWDASFFDGDDVFDDYEDWLVEAVRIAIRNPALDWVVKLHPANRVKLQRESQVEETELRALGALGPLPPHIKVLRSTDPINTASMFSAIDYGLTVRGTVGLELPCFGIPVVTAGTGRYDAYGFTIDPRTRTEFEQTLLTLQDVPRLRPEVVDLARRHAYWLLLRRQVSFADVLEPYDRLGFLRHPLARNYRILATTPDALGRSPSMGAFADWLLDTEEPDLLS